MNPTLIEVCARLSLCAYSGDEPGYGAELVDTVYLEDTDTMMRVYLWEKHLVFAVRGTVSKLNWKTNLTAAKKDGVHAGYREIALKLDDHVCEKLMQNRPERIVFTGHSLGGAVATLLAMQWSSVSDALITFGQPRVASAKLVREKLQCSYIRVVHGSDAVTQVPKIGYGHAGTLLYLANDGRNIVGKPDDIVGAVERGIDMMKDWLHESVTDHWMGDHYRRVKQ